MRLCKICKEREPIIDMCVECHMAIDFVQRMDREKTKSFEKGQLFGVLMIFTALFIAILFT